MRILIIYSTRSHSVDTYIKTQDPSSYTGFIEIANRAGKHDNRVRFLQVARKHMRKPKVDTELAYAYTRTDRLRNMEGFLGMSIVTGILEVGEKCFEDGRALPSCQVPLQQYL